MKYRNPNNCKYPYWRGYPHFEFGLSSFQMCIYRKLLLKRLPYLISSGKLITHERIVLDGISSEDLESNRIKSYKYIL